MNRLLSTLWLFLILSNPVWCLESSGSAEIKVPPKLSLDECLKMAIENNSQCPASKLGVEIAEAQHRQAMSSRYPRFNLSSSITRTDEPPNFIFPEEFSNYQISGMAPVPVNVGVKVPEKDIELAGRETTVHNLGMTFPVFTGGIREGLEGQAKAGIEAARVAVRKTDLKVVFDVERYYFGTVSARNLRKIAEETLIQMETTLELTERMYKQGSGKTKKTDFLRTKVIVEGIRGALAEAKGKEAAAKAALVNALGLGWKGDIDVSLEEIPVTELGISLDEAVEGAFRFNPDWASFKAGLSAAECALREKRGGGQPKLALIGNLTALQSGHDSGILSPRNKHSWSLGLALDVPVFDGNLTLNRIREARARLRKLEKEKILLREGIALKVKNLFLEIRARLDQIKSLKTALEAARENRELNVRAYRDELVETKEVIESQISEALAKAALETALFDMASKRSELDFTLGSEVCRWFQVSSPDKGGTQGD